MVGSHLLTSGLVSQGQEPESETNLMVGCMEGNRIFTSEHFKTYLGRRQKGESSEVSSLQPQLSNLPWDALGRSLNGWVEL